MTKGEDITAQIHTRWWEDHFALESNFRLHGAWCKDSCARSSGRMPPPTFCSLITEAESIQPAAVQSTRPALEYLQKARQTRKAAELELDYHWTAQQWLRPEAIREYRDQQLADAGTQDDMRCLMKDGGPCLASVTTGDEQSQCQLRPQGEEALAKSERWTSVFQVALVGEIWTGDHLSL